MDSYTSLNLIEEKGKENETKMEELLRFKSFKTIIDNKIIIKNPYFDNTEYFINGIIHNKPHTIRNTKHPSFEMAGSINDLIIKSKLPLFIDILSLCGGKCGSYTLFFTFWCCFYSFGQQY